MKAARVFVHCTALSYAAELVKVVPGVDRYAERALVLAAADDVVCVPRTVDVDYLDYLAALGLGPGAAGVVVVPPTAERGDAEPLWRRILERPAALGEVARLARGGGATRLQPFITSRGQVELAAALGAEGGIALGVEGGDPAVVEEADRKDRMRARALALGIPVAEGEAVELPHPGGRRRHDLDRLGGAIRRRLSSTGAVIVRGATGASGSSTFVVGRGGTDVETVLRRIARRSDNRVYLVEAMVEVLVSPNVQLHVAPEGGAVTFVGASDQRWGRPLAHVGNLYPTAAQTLETMIGHARVLAESLARDGYAGVIGFDFVEHLDADGRPRCFLAEVNPRVNGGTYPLAVRERLDARQRAAGRPPLPAFLSGVLTTRARTFAELRDLLAGHLFDPARGAGVVPYNPGLLDHGRCGVVVLGPSRDAVAAAFDAAARAARGPA